MTPEYVGIWRLIYDWQSLIAGLLAFAAGILAYIAGYVQAKATRQAAEMQMEAEQRKFDQEVDILRKSLATELQQIAERAHTVHARLKKWREKTNVSLPAWTVESLSRIPAPVVYPGSASKVGLLNDDAIDVMTIYSLFDIARDSAAQLRRYRTPDDITPGVVAGLARAFLQVYTDARLVSSKLRPAVDLDGEADKEHLEKSAKVASAATSHASRA